MFIKIVWETTMTEACVGVSDSRYVSARVARIFMSEKFSASSKCQEGRFRMSVDKNTYTSVFG